MKKPTTQARAHQKAATQKAQRRVAKKNQAYRDQLSGLKIKREMLVEDTKD